MFFLVEVHQFGNAWRLTDQGLWRRVDHNGTVVDADAKISEVHYLHRFLARDMLVRLDGTPRLVNASGDVGPDDHYDIRLFVVRKEPPRVPTKDELRQVLRKGDDRHVNTLVITVDGHFVLKDRSVRLDSFRDPDVAVRMESYGAGRGYVGPKAAADKQNVGATYRDYLALWTSHLRTGRLGIFGDMGVIFSEEDVLAELEKTMVAFGW